MRPTTAILCALVASLLVQACGSSNQDGPPPVFFGQEAHAFLVQPIVVEVLPSLVLPAPGTFDVVVQRAKERGVGSVKLLVEQPAPDATRSWDSQKIANFERDHTQLAATRGESHWTVLWLSGSYSGNLDAVAYTFGPHSSAVFPDVIGGRTLDLSAGLVHEFGHVLGLVRNPSHRDPSHVLHCRNKCVMFWTFDNTDDFCDPCKADIEQAKRSP